MTRFRWEAPGFGLRASGGVLLGLTLAACGGAGQEGQPLAAVAPSASASSSAPAGAASFPEEVKLARFHSKRFAMVVPLPDGKAWRIDDHTHTELTATHAATQSKLVVTLFADPELMNRQKCEEKARERKLVPPGEMRTVEEKITIGPETYDTRVWVAIEPGAPGKPLVGHVFAFGGFLRKCLFFHFSSEVPSANDEDVLSARLAVARTRVLDGITLDPFAEPPREKPGPSPKASR